MAGPGALRAISVLLVLLALPVSPMASAGEEDAVEGLLDIYHQAVDADPVLRGQDFAARALREQHREAFAGLLPQLGVNAEVRRIDREEVRSGFVDEEETERQYTQEQYALQLRQPLFDLPAWHGWQGSGLRADAGEADLEAQRQSLIQRVTEAYLGVLGARDGLALSKRELRALEAHRNQAEARYEEQMIAVSDLEAVRARHARAEAGVLRARSEVGEAHERLAEITGTRHGNLRELDSEFELPEVQDELDAWMERARRDNPELVAARARVDAGERNVRAARGERYPALDLTAGYTRFDDFDGSPQSRELDDLSVGLQLTMPLYQGGAVNARVRRAQNERNRDGQELEQARRAVESEVRRAFQALRSLRSEIRAHRQAVHSSERAVEAAELEVEAQTRSMVDLLDAQHELFSAHRDLARARHEYLIRMVELRRAAGQLGLNDVAALDRMLSATQAGLREEGSEPPDA